MPTCIFGAVAGVFFGLLVGGRTWIIAKARSIFKKGGTPPPATVG
jgi:hypothetical protein